MKDLTILSMSGGLDSATLCAEALHQGHEIFILNFNYGQKNIVEMKAFENLFDFYKREYISNGTIIGQKQIDLTTIFGEFTKLWQEMRDDNLKEKAHHQFYMPSRNLFFAVLSAVVGEIIALNKNYKKVNIGLGIHKHNENAYGKNHRDYWDITPEFAKRLSSIFELNDVINLNVFAPFADKTKADVVRRALELKVPYNLTWTCYNPSIKEGIAIPCLTCEACVERELAGKEVGINDINNYHIFLND